MTLPPYVLPVALAVGCLGLLLLALVLVKRTGFALMAGRQAAVLGSAWAGATIMVWRMAAPQNWQPPEGADSIINTLFTINFALLLAGGEESGPQVVAAAEARGRAAATTDARAELAHEIAQHIEAKDHDVPLSELAAQIRRYGGRRST